MPMEENLFNVTEQSDDFFRADVIAKDVLRHQ